MEQYIYQPLSMMNSSVLHYSNPLNKDTQHLADFYIRGPTKGPTSKTRKTYAKQISTLKKPIFPTLRKFGFQ